jgi:hypothetical protein
MEEPQRKKPRTESKKEGDNCCWVLKLFVVDTYNEWGHLGTTLASQLPLLWKFSCVVSAFSYLSAFYELPIAFEEISEMARRKERNEKCRCRQMLLVFHSQ